MMGEMTIRNIDDALMVELRDLALRRGMGPEALAIELLRTGLRRIDRAEGARRILALQTCHETDSTEIIREWRDQ